MAIHGLYAPERPIARQPIAVTERPKAVTAHNSARSLCATTTNSNDSNVVLFVTRQNNDSNDANILERPIAMNANVLLFETRQNNDSNDANILRTTHSDDSPCAAVRDPSERR